MPQEFSVKVGRSNPWLGAEFKIINKHLDRDLTINYILKLFKQLKIQSVQVAETKYKNQNIHHLHQQIIDTLQQSIQMIIAQIWSTKLTVRSCKIWSTKLTVITVQQYQFQQYDLCPIQEA